MPVPASLVRSNLADFISGFNFARFGSLPFVLSLVRLTWPFRTSRAFLCYTFPSFCGSLKPFFLLGACSFWI
jgi:hypothetical protein